MRWSILLALPFLLAGLAQAQAQTKDLPDARGALKTDSETPPLGLDMASNLLGDRVKTAAGETVGRIESVCLAQGHVTQVIVALSAEAAAAAVQEAARVALDYADFHLRPEEPDVVYLTETASIRDKPPYHYRDPERRGTVFGAEQREGAGVMELHCR